MTVSLAHDGASIGTAMGAPRFNYLVNEAGSAACNKLTVDDRFVVLFEQRP